MNEMQKQGLKIKASELDSSVRYEADAGNGNRGVVELGGGEREVVYEMEGSLVDLGEGDRAREKRRGGGNNKTRQ